MYVKQLLIGAGVLAVGYHLGKVVAYTRSIRAVVNMAEEIVPGTKEKIAKETADRIITNVFESKKKKH